MSDQPNGDSPRPAEPIDDSGNAPARASRRTFLKSSAGLVVGGGAIPALPHGARAQDTDAELARLLGQRAAFSSRAAWCCRRIGRSAISSTRTC